MEVIGQVFEIDGMNELLGKFEKGMSPVKFSAVVIQVSGLLLKENKGCADRIIAMNKEVTLDEVQQLDDGEYGNALKNAIISDVMGFFGSSQRTDGKL